MMPRAKTIAAVVAALSMGTAIVVALWDGAHPVEMHLHGQSHVDGKSRVARCATYAFSSHATLTGAASVSVSIEATVTWAALAQANGTRLHLFMAPTGGNLVGLPPVDAYVDLGKDNVVRQIASREDADSRALLALEAIVQAAEFVVPVHGQLAEWQSEQRDEYGKHVAAYRRDGSRILRTKLRYIDGRTGQPVPEVVESHADATFGNDHSLFEEAHGTEILHLSTFRATALADTTLRTTWTLTLLQGQACEAVVSGLLPAGYEWDRAPRVQVARSTRAETVTPATWEDHVREVRKQAQAGASHAKLLDLWKAWFKADPGGPARFLAGVRAGELADLEVAAGMYALSLAGTAASVACLREASLDPRLPPSHRERALWALSDAPVSAESGKTLLGLAGAADDDESVRQAALRAVGHLDSRLTTGDVSMSSEIHAEIQNALGHPSDTNDKLAALDAVFNSKSTSFGEQLSNFASDDDAMVRAHALSAMVAIGAPDAERLASAAVAWDDTPLVRSAAADALSEIAVKLGLTADTIATLGASLAKEQDQAARVALVTCLGEAGKKDNAAHDLLVQHFAHEVDPKILVHIGRFCAASELP